MIRLNICDDEDGEVPKEAKGPVHEDVVAGSEGDADEDEEQVSHLDEDEDEDEEEDADEDEEEVGHRQVEDQHVRRVLHLWIRMHLAL